MTYVDNIRKSGLTIYDVIPPEEIDLFIPTETLEEILSRELVGLSVAGLPLRTRSKFVKSQVAKALGYPVPNSFKKTQPRFPGQNFDVYTQKSFNVQIWNEEVKSSRRYVFLKINDADDITVVRVITGEELAEFDRTGTLTHKYQATMISRPTALLSYEDSTTVNNFISSVHNPQFSWPNELPSPCSLLPIDQIFNRLLTLVGQNINYLDALQERNRGAELHALICETLGYQSYEDDGSYPDIKNQLLEVKLQS